MDDMENQLKHIAIILDGNGRWASSTGLQRVEGHRAGVKAVDRVVEYCVKQEIPELSLFALSIENKLFRPEREVSFLINLLAKTLGRYAEKLINNDIRLRVIGDISSLPLMLKKQINRLHATTESNTRMQLNICINYSGRWDILQATRKILTAGLDPSVLTEQVFANYLCLSPDREPDLLIRTGGELRISNYFLWQLAYTELHFSNRLWPDFTEADLKLAIEDFNQRKRRYGRSPQELAVKGECCA
jgi:undecaprenyl diphosphate synthase